MNRFWKGGFFAYVSAAEKEHLARMKTLWAELRRASTKADVERIETEIRQERQAYRKRRAAANRSLF
jgi:hypothetical protein